MLYSYSILSALLLISSPGRRQQFVLDAGSPDVLCRAEIAVGRADPVADRHYREYSS